MRSFLDQTLETGIDRKAAPGMPRWLALLLAAAIVAGGLFLLRDQLHPPEAPLPSPPRIAPGDR